MVFMLNLQLGTWLERRLWEWLDMGTLENGQSNPRRGRDETRKKEILLTMTGCKVRVSDQTVEEMAQ
ncbi:hypothetical protein ACRALDRAFT_212764 [Sodiomyces alcalophilus JCM 7366]|uniref:uncharacterized protein n=1 Tax=Sodiomyces alcalophilus JCM 7366 TaxID=591952 RepID=UPI0039B5B989